MLRVVVAQQAEILPRQLLRLERPLSDALGLHQDGYVGQVRVAIGLDVQAPQERGQDQPGRRSTTASSARLTAASLAPGLLRVPRCQYGT